MRHTRRDLFAAASLVALIGLAAPASAQEHGESKGGDAKGDDDAARALDLGGVVFPVFDEKRQLRNYLFVSTRMMPGPDKSVWKYRDQLHFVRDAIIRAAHKVSFHQKDNFKKLDEKLAAAECLKAANAMLGEKDALVSMTFTQIASQS